MKTFLVKFIYFLLSICSLIIVLSEFDNLDKKTNLNSNIISLQRKSEFNELDILFIGNSYCYSSIQPILFDSIGLKTLNLGIASAGPQFYELIVNDYLSHINIPPKTIFMLVSPMTFSSQSDNFVEYPIHRYLENPVSNFSISIMNKQCLKLSKMYQKSFKRASLNLLAKQSIADYSLFLIDKGFIKNDIVVNQKIIEKDKKFYDKLTLESIDYSKIRKLEDLIKKLESKGIEIFLFELPTYLLNKYFNKNYLNEYELELSKIKMKNILFRIDKNLFFADSYRNIDHMNISGSIIATKLLISEISENKRLNTLFSNKFVNVKSNILVK